MSYCLVMVIKLIRDCRCPIRPVKLTTLHTTQTCIKKHSTKDHLKKDHLGKKKLTMLMDMLREIDLVVSDQINLIQMKNLNSIPV